METAITIVTYGVQWGIETAFLLLALWFMARIQKLQYTIVGLLVSSAIACAFDLIPFVGHYIAIAALWVSLTKVTREDFTGVAFTAGISYALVFGMNLFLLGALMGDLRPSVRARSFASTPEPTAVATESEAGDGPALGSEEDQAPTAAAAVAPANAPAPASAAPDTKPAADTGLVKAFVLKGVTLNGKNSMALLAVGGKTYTLFLGQSASVETAAGRKIIRLQTVDKNAVVLDVAGQLIRVTEGPAE